MNLLKSVILFLALALNTSASSQGVENIRSSTVAFELQQYPAGSIPQLLQ